MDGRKHARMVLSRLVLAGALVVSLIVPAAYAADAPKIRIEKAWARPGVAMAAKAGATHGGEMGMKAMPGNSAVYMVLHNDGGTADRLAGAAADVARAVELHQTKIDGGMAQMMKIAGIDLPAKRTVELKPGGLHIMLIGLKRDLKAGDKFPVTLKFQKSREIRLMVEVRAP